MYIPLKKPQLEALLRMAADDQCRMGLATFPQELLALIKRQEREYLEGYVACLYDILALIGQSLADQTKTVSTFEWIMTILKTSGFLISNVVLHAQKKIEENPKLN